MAVKKCKCEKCGYCKQIYWLANKRVNCIEYGNMAAPTHCDRFITIEEYQAQQRAKEDYDRQMKHLEYVWSIVEMKRGK